MLAQHKAYNASLNIMVTECYAIYQNAREILKDFGPDPLLGPLENLEYDHRCLQDHHDHLAAYWRKQSGYMRPQLLKKSEEEYVGEWQAWLQNEIRGWFFHSPTVITTFRSVLTSDKIGGLVAESCSEGFRLSLTQLYAL